MRARRLIGPLLLVFALTGSVTTQQPATGGASAIRPGELKEWLSYIASDELEGRQLYSEGLGLAASYIAAHLKAWGVKPGGDNGTYFQTVKIHGVRTTSRSTVSVTVSGQTRTFKDGEGITFPRNMGGRQTVRGAQVQFVGYGLQIPSAGIDDYKGVDPKGRVIIYIGSGPADLPAGSNRLIGARARLALEKGAAAIVSPPLGFGGRGRGGTPGTPPAAGQPQGAPPVQPAVAAPGQPPPSAAPAQGGRGGAQPIAVDFTTVQRYDASIPPQVTAQDDFFEFLFSGSAVKYSELKARADKREPLPPVALDGVTMTFDVDADYTVARTQRTRNVVGIVEGTDPELKDTYVLFGAHYDHVGYRDAGGPPAGGQPNPGGCEGQTRPTPRADDIISNGADDDGSGTVAIMGVAKAFAQGPKPRRSVMFVWFSGEEVGLLGSRYKADYPLVPNDRIVAMLNADMVGRNRCDRESESNTVYLVGSDRISTELHNLSEDANASMAKPMKLDYEMNDPADPESIYTRSDHYSFAAKGIPIIFYTTGLHKDYHFVTDEVDKIEFEKLARIAGLIYTTGARVANLDRAPQRDNKGPRVGKGAGGKIADR